LPTVNNCRALVVIGRACSGLDNDHFLSGSDLSAWRGTGWTHSAARPGRRDF
jgi:hypothetical protein